MIASLGASFIPSTHKFMTAVSNQPQLLLKTVQLASDSFNFLQVFAPTHAAIAALGAFAGTAKLPVTFTKAITDFAGPSKDLLVDGPTWMKRIFSGDEKLYHFFKLVTRVALLAGIILSGYLYFVGVGAAAPVAALVANVATTGEKLSQFDCMRFSLLASGTAFSLWDNSVVKKEKEYDEAKKIAALWTCAQKVREGKDGATAEYHSLSKIRDVAAIHNLPDKKFEDYSKVAAFNLQKCENEYHKALDGRMDDTMRVAGFALTMFSSFIYPIRLVTVALPLGVTLLISLAGTSRSYYEGAASDAKTDYEKWLKKPPVKLGFTPDKLITPTAPHLV